MGGRLKEPVSLDWIVSGSYRYQDHITVIVGLLQCGYQAGNPYPGTIEQNVYIRETLFIVSSYKGGGLCT